MRRALLSLHRRRIVVRRVLSSLLLAGLLVAPQAAQSQSARLQGAWVADQVAGPLVGLEWRKPMGSVPEQPATGPLVMQTRDWMFTGEVAAGVNLSPDDHDVEVLFYAHGGVLWRTGSDLLGRVGGVVAGYVPAGVVGPAARVELAGAIDVQLGWMFGRGDGHLHVALDVATAFIGDLLGG